MVLHGSLELNSYLFMWRWRYVRPCVDRNVNWLACYVEEDRRFEQARLCMWPRATRKPLALGGEQITALL